MDKEKERPFKYCVVGNIVKERIDEDGSVKHGTIEFSGGTKVFLCGKLKYEDPELIDVIGLGRLKIRGYRRYRVATIKKKYIENVRSSRTYVPAVLKFMNDTEFYYFDKFWWHDSLQDKKETEEFVEQWNENLKEEKDCEEV